MRKVFKREFDSYFKTPLAYVFGALILLVTGAYAIYYNLSGGISNFEYAVNNAAWVFLILVPAVCLRTHMRLHADDLPSQPKASKADGKEDGSSSMANLVLFHPSKKDVADAAKAKEEGDSPASRVLSAYFTNLLALLLPCLILLIDPLILKSFGDVYLPSAFSQVAAFFFLGAALLGIGMLFAACEKSQLLAVFYTLLAVIGNFFIVNAATLGSSAFTSMLVLSAVIVLIALAVYLVTRRSVPALATAVVLIVAQLIVFLVMRTSYAGTSYELLSHLSLVERFHNFTGGLFDITALLYFASMAFLLVFLSVKAYEAYCRRQEAVASLQEASQDAARLKRRGHAEEADKTLSSASENARKNTFSFRQALIAIAAVVVVNGAVSGLTGDKLILDVSSTRLFTLSPQLEEQIGSLTEPTDLYWIATNGKEDATLRSALYRLDASSRKLNTKRLLLRDSDFITKYVAEDVYDNSLLVMSAGNSRFISYTDLYTYDYSHYEQDQVADLVFNLQDDLDSALEYVSGAEMAKLYQLDGHNETMLSDYFTSIIQKENLSISTLTLDENGVPDDAAVLLINNPMSDFSDSDTAAIKDYLAGGGKILIDTSLSMLDSGYPNIDSILALYGASRVEGIVVESSSNAYDQSYLYDIIPSILDHEATQEVVNHQRSVYLSQAQGISLSGIEGITSTPILRTSDSSFSKVEGFSAATLDQEEKDISGPFTVGAVMEDTSNQSSVIWVSSPSLLDDNVNEQSKGGNQYLVIGALNYLSGEEILHTAIPAVQYNYGSMTVTANTKTRLGLVMAGAFPLVYFLIGFCFWLSERRKNLAAQEAREEALRQEKDEKRAAQRADQQSREEALRLAREKAERERRERAKSKNKEKQKRSYAPLMGEEEPPESSSASSSSSEESEP